ncbi:hypothetical protein DSL72_005430 [Monilinia vaccinii-corymbosi]|uniref:Nitrogen regulatory protein areA GATA-like domain-containing protein n=1 Tax=Monilinia vaccinii-corymbosi TaxID=61207 RepID=A0A8A3PF54_9HELO|nr:hypothetical protein DSL72_005430 [Monilinia vaccinii-corymbosi]
MELSREDEYFEWVDLTDVVDAAPRIIRQPEVSVLRIIGMDNDDDNDEIEFPSYDDIRWNDKDEYHVPKEEYDAQVEYYLQSPSLQPAYLEDDISLCSSTPSLLSPSDQSPPTELAESPEVFEPCDITATLDDTAIQTKPSRHVDYLAHDWPEEDLWSSWKYIQSNRTAYENGRRLENASWRCWAKKRSNLKTIAPETVNWEKDCDTTWLYGPLHKKSSSNFLAGTSVGSNSRSNLTRSVSFAVVHVKPILKQRRLRDILLKPRSSSTGSVSMESSLPSLSSGRSSPSTTSSRKCVRFHDEVEQFVAVNASYKGEGVITCATGESLEDDLSASTTGNVQSLSTSYIRTVVKLSNTTQKNANGVHLLSAAVHSLQDSLQHDHFVLPRFEYEEYASIVSGNDDDDEWELSMIGKDLKSPVTSMAIRSIY